MKCKYGFLSWLVPSFFLERPAESWVRMISIARPYTRPKSQYSLSAGGRHRLAFRGCTEERPSRVVFRKAPRRNALTPGLRGSSHTCDRAKFLPAPIWKLRAPSRVRAVTASHRMHTGQRSLGMRSSMECNGYTSDVQHRAIRGPAATCFRFRTFVVKFPATSTLAAFCSKSSSNLKFPSALLRKSGRH